MSIPYEKVFLEFSKESQERIKQRSAELIKEYNSLQAFRKDIGLTQDELAGRLCITQENVSRLERRKDMHLSTLRKYVEALGCELEINIRVPKNKISNTGDILRI